MIIALQPERIVSRVPVMRRVDCDIYTYVSETRSRLKFTMPDSRPVIHGITLRVAASLLGNLGARDRATKTRLSVTANLTLRGARVPGEELQKNVVW